MGIRKEELASEALKLPAQERAALARRLIESLDVADAGDLEAEWIAEAERRYAEYRKGTVSARDADIVFPETKRRLK